MSALTKVRMNQGFALINGALQVVNASMSVIAASSQLATQMRRMIEEDRVPTKEEWDALGDKIGVNMGRLSKRAQEAREKLNE